MHCFVSMYIQHRKANTDAGVIEYRPFRQQEDAATLNFI